MAKTEKSKKEMLAMKLAGKEDAKDAALDKKMGYKEMANEEDEGEEKKDKEGKTDGKEKLIALLSKKKK